MDGSSYASLVGEILDRRPPPDTAAGSSVMMMIEPLHELCVHMNDIQSHYAYDPTDAAPLRAGTEGMLSVLKPNCRTVAFLQ